jgi:hypothetical protein
MKNHDIGGLDKQIEYLFQCKPLPEADIKQLCEKVHAQINSGQINPLIITQRRPCPSTSHRMR